MCYVVKFDYEEDINLNKFALFEVNIKNDDLIVNNVGEDVASTVTNLLLQKAKNNLLIKLINSKRNENNHSFLSFALSISIVTKPI